MKGVAQEIYFFAEIMVLIFSRNTFGYNVMKFSLVFVIVIKVIDERQQKSGDPSGLKRIGGRTCKWKMETGPLLIFWALFDQSHLFPINHPNIIRRSLEETEFIHTLFELELKE